MRRITTTIFILFALLAWHLPNTAFGASGQGFSSWTKYTEPIADGDYFGMTDVSDTAQSSDGTSKAATALQVKVYLDQYFLDDQDATEVSVTATGFNGILTTTDDTVQKMAQKLDDLAATQMPVDASGFGGNLALTDDTLQEVAQKLNDLPGLDNPTAEEVDVNTTAFGNNLSAYDSTVQNALNTIDDLVIPVDTDDQLASDVPVESSGFNGMLTTTDDTVQKVAQKFDDLSITAANTSVSAAGFDGNLTVSDDTVQEVAQKFDDIAVPTNLTSFVNQTNWRLFYSNGSGDVTELVWGVDGTYLRSNGTTSAPTFDVPSGSGDMLLAGIQAVTGLKTFDPSKVAMKGTSTGVTTIQTANTSANNYGIILPAASGTFALTSDVPTAASLSVDDLITLSGVSTGAVNLGAFTGTTIADNVTNKAAMQALETAVELRILTSGIGSTVQAYDADLTTYAGITPSANIQSLLGSADYSTARTNLGLAIGTNVQAYDADLTTWAGVTPGTGVATMLAVNQGSAGSAAKIIASGTSAMGTGAIASATCATVVTTAATGVATTDVINWGFNGDPTGITGYVPSTNGMLTIISYPSVNNVNYKVCNNTSASITPGALTLNWKVFR